MMSTLVILVVVVVMQQPRMVYGWWGMPHMLVAALAQLEMSPRSLQIVQSILSSSSVCVPGYSSIIASSLFPDHMKDQRLTAFNSWHKAETPLVLDNFAITAAAAAAAVADNNITWAGKEMQSTLSGGAKMPWPITFALRYAIHLVGDIHEPLHVSNLFSSRFPNGDQQGNLFKISYSANTNITNLHTFWGSCGGQFADPSGQIKFPLSVEDENGVLEQARQMIAMYDVSEYSLASDWSGWANESYQLAATVAYSGVTFGEQLSEEGDDSSSNSTSNSSSSSSIGTPGYVEKTRRVCMQRLRLAGARLAHLLDSTATNLMQAAVASQELVSSATSCSSNTTATTTTSGSDGFISVSKAVASIAGLGIFIAGAIVSSLATLLVVTRSGRRRFGNLHDMEEM